MGISYRIPVPVVRTGVERATLVRRTYALVFASVLVTIAGAAFGLSQPTIMEQVAAHPIITMLLMFAPLFMAMRARTAFPANIGFTCRNPSSQKSCLPSPGPFCMKSIYRCMPAAQ